MTYYLCHIYSRKERGNPSLFLVLLGNFPGVVNQAVDTDGTRKSTSFALPPLKLQTLCLYYHPIYTLVNWYWLESTRTRL
jgi:hypothetical protein